MKLRLGRFYCSREFLLNYRSPATRYLMERISPLEITWNWCARATVTAISDIFEPVSEGNRIPLYEINFHSKQSESGTVIDSMTIKKIEEA